jgi:hypothetical protein
VWHLSIVQGPFYVAPCQTPTYDDYGRHSGTKPFTLACAECIAPVCGTLAAMSEFRTNVRGDGVRLGFSLTAAAAATPTAHDG